MMITCPSHLKGEAKREWKRVLKADQHIQTEDRAVLAIYCQAWARLVEHEKILAGMGEIWTPMGSQLHPHTCYTVIRDQIKVIERYSDMLGLSPRSREKFKKKKKALPPSPNMKPKTTIPSHLKVHA